METNIGACVYCGKTRILTTSGAITEGEANALVTQTCDCERARQNRALEGIESSVTELLQSPKAEDNGFRPEEGALWIAQRTAEAVGSEQIAGAQITLSCGDTLKFALKKGVVEITRTRKVERTTVSGGSE